MSFTKHIEKMQRERNRNANISIDPYEFIFKYCYTIDQGAQGKESNIKQFPDYDYLRLLVKEFVEED